MHIFLNDADKSAEELAHAVKVADPIEEGKTEDKKRTFMVPFRPHQKIWNLDFNEEECHECKDGQNTGNCCGERPKHVLRADADPAACYIDGRIKKF